MPVFLCAGSWVKPLCEGSDLIFITTLIAEGKLRHGCWIPKWSKGEKGDEVGQPSPHTAHAPECFARTVIMPHWSY